MLLRWFEYFVLTTSSSALEGDFNPYLSAFLPFLINALQAHQEYQLCGIAIGLIGDISRALGPATAQYAQGFMEVLLANLQSTVLHRSAKPPILSTFGDIALALGGDAYQQYLETTMQVLQQAGSMRTDSVCPFMRIYKNVVSSYFTGRH